MPYVIAGAIAFPAMLPWALRLPTFRYFVFLLGGALTMAFAVHPKLIGAIPTAVLISVPFYALCEELLKFGMWQRFRGYEMAFAFAFAENVSYFVGMVEDPLMSRGAFWVTVFLRVVFCTAIHLSSIVWFERYRPLHALAIATTLHTIWNAGLFSGHTPIASVAGFICLYASVWHLVSTEHRIASIRRVKQPITSNTHTHATE